MLSSKKIPLEFYNNPGKFKKFHKIKLEKSIKFYRVSEKGTQFISPEIKFMPVKQLIAVLKIIKPTIKKIGRKTRLVLNTWPTTILTRKPKDIRMGRGKGAPTDRVAIAGNKSLLNLRKIRIFRKAKKILTIRKKKVHKSKYLQTHKW